MENVNPILECYLNHVLFENMLLVSDFLEIFPIQNYGVLTSQTSFRTQKLAVYIK